MSLSKTKYCLRTRKRSRLLVELAQQKSNAEVDNSSEKSETSSSSWSSGLTTYSTLGKFKEKRTRDWVKFLSRSDNSDSNSCDERSSPVPFIENDFESAWNKNIHSDDIIPLSRHYLKPSIEPNTIENTLSQQTTMTVPEFANEPATPLSQNYPKTNTGPNTIGITLTQLTPMAVPEFANESAPQNETERFCESKAAAIERSALVTENETTASNLVEQYIQNNLDKKKKKRTVCKFCREEVTNVERHLLRHHAGEKEVQEYLSFPKTKDGMKTRRGILALLRYKARFDEYIMNDECNSEQERLPCSHCKRLLAPQYLRRHYTKCILKPINDTGRYIQHRAISQSMVTCASEHAHINASLRVKNEVFTKMASDKIGFVARKDRLIRSYGEMYLKKHNRPQMATVCSNKMWECARLLIEIRRCTGNPKLTIYDSIHPAMFDIVVLSTEGICQYDTSSNVFLVPSFALHLGTTLEQLSELAINLLTKQSPLFPCEDREKRLKEVKRFLFLIKTAWNKEVSSLALKNLNEKRWKKPVLLPLTKDVITFRNYILETAEKNLSALNENNKDKKAYKNLVNATLAFTILFNRRRIGDVQYTKIESYYTDFSSNNQHEFLENLTESERVLTKNYKRIVAGGKGSKEITILFPPKVQQYLTLLLSLRDLMVLVENKYLFAHPGVKDHWIQADAVLRTLSKTCPGLTNPETITSNKLRKQIATLMQLINLDKNESAEFAKFMGHTEKTHREFYEVTQDVYQTAKIGKLLTMFDKGEGNQFKGKLLKDINIQPDLEAVQSDDDSDDDPAPIASSSHTNGNDDPSGEVDSPPKTLKGKKPSGRIRWTEEQKQIVSAHFANNIRTKKAPNKKECSELIEKHSCLQNLDWVRVTTFVYNTYTKGN